jgi:hypothetical protein
VPLNVQSRPVSQRIAENSLKADAVRLARQYISPTCLCRVAGRKTYRGARSSAATTVACPVTVNLGEHETVCFIMPVNDNPYLRSATGAVLALAPGSNAGNVEQGVWSCSDHVLNFAHFFVSDIFRP